MRRPIANSRPIHMRILLSFTFFSSYGELLGPFYGAIAVPSVTRCRRRRRGHRCARHLVNGRAAARSGVWAQHFSNASCLSKVADFNLLHRYLAPSPPAVG